MSRFLAIYGLHGSKPLSRLLCFISRYYKVNALILLGSTISPTLIKWFFEICNIPVLGILDQYDNISIAHVLSEYNALIECKIKTINGVNIYGVGLSGCNRIDTYTNRIDILATSIPGLKYTCCREGSDTIDTLIEHYNPLIVLTGYCSEPCIEEKLFSPGHARRGFIGIIEINKDITETSIIQIDDFTVKMLTRGMQ